MYRPILSLLFAAQLSLVHAQPSSKTTTTTTTATTPSPTAPTAPTTSGVSAPSTSISLTTVPVSLLSTNPTAVPIASLTSGEPSAPTTPLYTTFPAGATNSAVSGAPSLPDISTLNPANYPALDKVPPTDSQEVQAWISEVNSSNIFIPGIPPTLPGGCPANPGPVANASSSGSCWWTCGHCSRSTDVITCADKFTWGSSFDDGPSFYTPNLLEYLNQQSIQTTFFVVGSRAISFPATLQTEYMTGHQIAVHTWSHPSLTTLTNEQIIAEFGWSKKIIKDVTGVTPIFFRPPFGDIDDRVRAIAKAMNLIPIIWTSNPSWSYTFDTNDFNIPGGLVSSSQVIENFVSILNNASSIDTGFIVLEHDLFEQTVQLATSYIIPDALAFKPSLKLKPVVECLNQQLSDAYLETNNNNSNPLPVSASGVATLSSGAPGSLQPTGGAAQTGAALQRLPINPGFAIVGVLMGVLSIAFA